MKYIWLACVSLLASCGFAQNGFAQNQFVYTNDNIVTGTQNSPNTVSVFKVASDGSLSLIAESPYKTGGNGGGDNIDPEEITIASRRSASFLYAANNGSGSITGFGISPSSGKLAVITGSPFSADGPPGGDYSLAVSPDTRFLYAASDTSNFIHIYSIGSVGALTEIAGSPFQTGFTGQGLKVTANGKFLIVGDITDTAVAVYSIDSTGALTAVGGSPFAASATPLNLDADCASNQVFVVDAVGTGLIDVYAMATNGKLTPVKGEPFSNGTTSTSGGLALSPNNPFLFVTDTFSQDISSLSISSEGALTQVQGSPFGTSDWPGGTSVTADGKFLYSAFFASGAVDGHRINAKGELEAVPNTPFTTGQPQIGVPTVITFPRPSCTAR
jgi:6-phosphogluconolactonase